MASGKRRRWPPGQALLSTGRATGLLIPWRPFHRLSRRRATAIITHLLSPKSKTPPNEKNHKPRGPLCCEPRGLPSSASSSSSSSSPSSLYYQCLHPGKESEKKKHITKKNAPATMISGPWLRHSAAYRLRANQNGPIPYEPGILITTGSCGNPCSHVKAGRWE